MSIYMTEDEQWESIKKWWSRYGNIMVTIFSVVLLTIAGFRYWHWHIEKINQQASNTYEQLIMAASNHDNKLIQSYANELISNYSISVYADAAHLTLAKLYVEHEKYAQARDELSYVAKHAKMPALQNIATLRLARIMTAQKEYDNALTELKTVENSVYKPIADEIKGDIFAAQGDLKQAKLFYASAKRGLQAVGATNLFLDMKMNEAL